MIELWVAVALMLVQLYDWRAGKRLEYPPGRQLGARGALAVGVALGLCAVSFHVLVSAYPTAVQKQDIWITAGGLLMYYGCSLGLRQWFAGSWFKYVARALAVVLVTVFMTRQLLDWPRIPNNLIVLLTAAGVGVELGRRVSIRFGYAFYALLLVYDAYAVWYSGIMDTLFKIPVVPTGIIAFYTTELGAGDVIFACLGAVIVKRFCGTWWSLAASAMYVLSLSVPSWPVMADILRYFGLGGSGSFPLMVTICPITIFCLWVGTNFEVRTE